MPEDGISSRHLRVQNWLDSLIWQGISWFSGRISGQSASKFLKEGFQADMTGVCRAGWWHGLARRDGAVLKKDGQTNTFDLTFWFGFALLILMSATKTRKKRCCWRKDLAEFRGLTDLERTGFLLVLEWSRKGLRPTRFF
jgi:hypothetical protein